MKSEEERTRRKINRTARKAWQTLEEIRAVDPLMHHMATAATCSKLGITPEDWERTLNAMRDGLVAPDE